MPPRKLKFSEKFITIKSIYNSEIISILKLFLIQDICFIIDYYLEIKEKVICYIDTTFRIDSFYFYVEGTNKYSIQDIEVINPNMIIYPLYKNKSNISYPTPLNDSFINFVLNLYKKDPITNLTDDDHNHHNYQVHNDEDMSYKVVIEHKFSDGEIIKNGLIIRSFGYDKYENLLIHIIDPDSFVGKLLIFKKAIQIM
jgi:hypothetical protein